MSWFDKTFITLIFMFNFLVVLGSSGGDYTIAAASTIYMFIALMYGESKNEN